MPAALLACLVWLTAGGETGEPTRVPVRLVSIIDGDTARLVIHGQVERARLIGIDAPEMGQPPWGPRARRALARLAPASAALTVELDVQPRDRYGRLLVYLFAADTLVNERMLHDGYAVLLTIPPNVRYADRLRRAQHQARAAQRGIWAAGGAGLQEEPSEYRRQSRGER